MNARCFAAALLVACAPEPAESVTLTPETPDVEAALRAADARWEAAGVAPHRVVIGPGGAPARFAPELAPASVTRIRYSGRVFVGVRHMTLGSLRPGTVAHELGHALGVAVPVLDDDHLHGEACADDAPGRPTMCERGGMVITAADLDLACSVGPCATFNPEM